MKIEGRNPVIELLRSGRRVKKLFIEKDINRDGKITEILKLGRKRHAVIEHVPKKKLTQMSETGNHQGVIALADIEIFDLSAVLESWDEMQTLQEKSISLIYIREAQLEENVGAITRSAEAAGFSGVIVPPKLKITPQMFRSSMGAMANTIIMQESLFIAIKTAKDFGLKIISIEISDNALPYSDADLTGNTLFIIGGEDRSISEPIQKQSDAIVKIPMHGKINSLNMSVAASIVMFEKLRQENTND